MPMLSVRDGARCVVRPVDRSIPLETLCPSPPPAPYASAGWTVAPEGRDALALLAPDGTRHGSIAPGAPLALGDVTLAIAAEDGARCTATARLAGESRPMLALVVGARRVPLGVRTLRIGSDAARADIVLDDPAVSRAHCRIVPVRAGWEIHDEGSTNGTRVGGVRVDRAMLAPGVAITLGRTRVACTLAEPVDDARDAPSGTLVGDSPAMDGVRRDVERHAAASFPVLVHGETGSGKELVARMLHARSPRRSRGPFVAINAATIAPDLVESELFGHERGSFTGAQSRRRGVFEEASGGTLFLDEVGELPLAQQAKLLRVIETGEVRRVGAEGSVRVDVRIVCATHRDLAARVEDGAFRRDLLYRLDVLRVRIPPLRERLEDLPGLARHLLARASSELGVVRTLDDDALGALLAYDWPGNVRELYGALCRAAVDAEGERVGAEHLAIGHARAERHEPARDSGTFALPPPPALPRELEPEALSSLLASCGNNLSRVARVTGLARSTLRDRLRRAAR